MPMAFNGFGRPTFNPNQRFGDGMDPITGAMSLSGGVAPQFSMPASSGDLPAAIPLPPAQPSTWGRGGKGWDTVGKIGDVLAAFGGRQGLYRQQQQEDAQQALANQFKQQQLTIEAWKARQANRTPFQNNYEYLRGLGRPQDAEAYLANTVDPITLGIDPTNGTPTFVHKSGAPAAPATSAAPPIVKTLPDGSKAYWVNGAWYDNPEGK